MIDDNLWFEISSELEKHHAIFYKLWQMGKPEFTNEVPTGGIKFDKDGNFFRFLFNPDFWNSLDFNNKLFLICHECLHVILNHGARIKDSKNTAACNQALDIVVNHLLISKFSFERKDIQDWSSLCWVDTIFTENGIPTDEAYEYYYNLFQKKYGDGSPLGEIKLVDDHSFEEDSLEAIKEIEDISDEEKQSLADSLGKHAGDGSDEHNFFLIKKKKIVKKLKWETVIKKWSYSILKNVPKDIEQWARLSRRLSMLPRDMFLPSDWEVDTLDKQKDKIEVYFFLDTSGSCWSYKDRFFNAAKSLPENKFNVHLFCFDTQVYPTTLESQKVYGGLGTSFKILEQYIQRQIKENKIKYPDGIFVITDGYGDLINPSFPKQWHWFMVENGTKKLIAKECNFYELSDFE